MSLRDKIKEKTLRQIILQGVRYCLFRIPFFSSHIRHLYREIPGSENKTKKLFRYIYGQLFANYALKKSINEFKRIEKKESNPERKFIGWGNYISIHPMQSESTLQKIIEESISINAKVICEIGTAKGGTLYRLSKISQTCISIDLPANNPRRFIRSNEKFLEEITSNTHFIRGNSHNKETEEKLKNALNGNKIDLLFIDGDHSYEGVKDDFNRYNRYMNQGGKILFHDIYQSEGVNQLWQEIKEKYETEEFKQELGIVKLN